MIKIEEINYNLNQFESQSNQKRIKEIINNSINSTYKAVKIIPNKLKGDKCVVIVSDSEANKPPDSSLNRNQILFCQYDNNHLYTFLEGKHLLVRAVGILELEYYVKQNFEYLNALESLTLSFCKKVDKQVDYSHQIEETSFKFLLINQKLQKGFYESEVKLDDEIVKLIGQTHLRQLKEDVQVKSNEKKKKTGKEFTLFEKLIYYYTTNALYLQLNRLFAESNYESIEQIMCTLFDGYSKLQQKQLAQNKLFRGIHIWDEKIFNEIMDQLKLCEKDKTSIFWNALTSTTSEMKNTGGFMGQNQSILFEITLSKINPHPYFILESYHSKYSTEKEVLLFPQFQFKIVEIKTQGRNYYCRIQQIDNNLSMVLNSNSREKYWQERINNELIPKLHTLASFLQLRINAIMQRLSKFSMPSDMINKSLKDSSDEYFYKLVSLFQQFCDNQDVHKNYLSKLLSLIQNSILFLDSIYTTGILQESKILIEKITERLINEFILIIKQIYNLENFTNDIQRLVQNREQSLEILRQQIECGQFNQDKASRRNFEISSSITQKVQNNVRTEKLCQQFGDLNAEYLQYLIRCSKQIKGQIPMISDDFDPKYNKRWEGCIVKKFRGPPYHKYDFYKDGNCFGVGLDVRKYGQNQDWLKKDGNQNEWRILFHGTKSQAVSSIVKNNLIPGRSQFYCEDECQDEYGRTIQVGEGVYFTNSVKQALDYAPYFQIGDRQYAVVIMVRVNPKKIRQSRKMSWYNYFLVNDSQDIRPYRIILHENN